MKLGILVASGLFVAGVLPALAANEPAAVPVSPGASGDAVFEAQLHSMVDRIRNKLSSGAHTEEALQDELKAFDGLLAAQKGNTSKLVAQANLMRAMLYVDVFQDFDKAAALLEEMKKDFAGLEAAAAAEEVLAQVRPMQAMARIQSALKPGTAFPDFAEQDVAGQPLSIAKYRGKIVLVDFWATWCGPCMEEMPNVQAAYAKYHGKGFEIVGISLDKDEAKLKSFLAEKKMSWQQYFDGKGWENKLGQKYGVNSIPTSFLLDRQGTIIAKDLRSEELGAKLDELLGKL